MKKRTKLWIQCIAQLALGYAVVGSMAFAIGYKILFM
jgi:hypothetical protein